MLKSIALTLLLVIPGYAMAENKKEEITSLGDMTQDVTQQMDELTKGVKDLFLLMSKWD